MTPSLVAILCVVSFLVGAALVAVRNRYRMPRRGKNGRFTKADETFTDWL